MSGGKAEPRCGASRQDAGALPLDLSVGPALAPEPLRDTLGETTPGRRTTDKGLLCPSACPHGPRDEAGLSLCALGEIEARGGCHVYPKPRWVAELGPEPGAGFSLS